MRKTLMSIETHHTRFSFTHARHLGGDVEEARCWTKVGPMAKNCFRSNSPSMTVGLNKMEIFPLDA